MIMNLNIGKKIKYLRHEKDITQEEFAAVLGVSYQSVSRWENDICYPDIELLPNIAEFFGITVDSLMGLDEAARKENLAKYLEAFQEAVSQGRIDDCIAIARKGVAEYPDNYKLLNKLMYALFLAGDSDGNIPEWQENMRKYDSEITMLGERIMKYCPDQDIRLEAAGRLAFNHCEMGRREIGRAIFETLPSQKYCREAQIWWGLDEGEKLPFVRGRIREGYAAMHHGIYLLLEERLLPDEELLKVCRKLSDLQELVFDGRPPAEWGTVRNHCTMAALCARLKQYDLMYDELRTAVEAAREFDMRTEQYSVSSVLFGNVTKGRTDYETSDSRTLCEIVREKWLAAEDFHAVRDSEAFGKIIQVLA